MHHNYLFTEDIEVVTDDNVVHQGDSNPPSYEDLDSAEHQVTKDASTTQATEAASTSKTGKGIKLQHHLSHPLKHIIKKSDKTGDKPDKAKVSRKESDSQKTTGGIQRSASRHEKDTDGNSPRHTFPNGMGPGNELEPGTSYITSDLDLVKLEITDPVESEKKMVTIDHIHTTPQPDKSSASTSGSGKGGTHHQGESTSLAAHLKERFSKIHSKDQRHAASHSPGGHTSESSSKESLNTHL